MSQKLPFEQIHQHEYTTRVVPATCSERGYTLHVCECGDEYKDSFTPLGPHDFKPDGEVAPTCTQPGKRLFACSVCGAKKEEPIPATGHQLGASSVMVHPGCVSEGISEGKCALCGETVQTLIPPTGHRFGEWTDRKKARCENSGVRARQCEVCGKIESEETPALGHDFSKWSAAAGDPIKEERYCLRCGMTENRNGDDAQTLYNVGKTHLTNGRYADARENLRLAAEKGLPKAQYEYGLLLQRKKTGFKKDKKTGNAWIAKAAENGDRKAGEWIKRNKTAWIVALSFLGALCIFPIRLFTVIIPRYRTFVYDGTNSAADTGKRYTKAIIQDGVTEIKANPFLRCPKLTSVTIPDSVTSIGEHAFYGCSGLTSITIPNSVTSIGYKAFCACSKLTSVTIPDGVTSIGNEAFSCCSKLTSITIPNSVTSIGDGAFSYCSKLTSVIIPDGVTSIKKCAFEHCSGLTSITIPDSVTSIGNEAFRGCSGLTSVTIGNSVKSIEYAAFYDCRKLISITIPDSVTRIRDKAFWNCSGLTSVTFENANGWCRGDASSGVPMTMTDPAQNAKYLQSTYCRDCWYRK